MDDDTREEVGGGRGVGKGRWTPVSTALIGF